MSQDEFDVDSALEDDSVPAGLRQWAEAQKKANKKLADELAAVRTEQRSGAVTGALKALGVNERVATFYPADAEASPEAVKNWLKANEGVFAPVPAAPDGGDQMVQPSGLTDHSPLNADLVAAMRQVQDATPVAGAPTPTIADRANEIDGLRMRTADDRAKLDSFVAELQQMARQTQTAHIAGFQR